MKKIIGIGLFFFFVVLGNIRGQKLFMDSTYIWSEYHTFFFQSDRYTVRYTFDSIPTEINGKQYYERLANYKEQSGVWQRTKMYYRDEDTGKVFLNHFGNEWLIYDYSLNAKDSFLTFFGVYLVADFIDTIQLQDGEFRKRWAMRCSFDDDPLHGWGYNYWIEGLGSYWGVYDAYTTECIPDGDQDYTLCIYRNDTLLFNNPEFDSCWMAPVATKELKPDLISFYPNPASSEITIDSKDHLVQKISVVDLLGNEILIGKNSPLDISLFPPGYYFLQIELENKQLIMKRFVKQ